MYGASLTKAVFAYTVLQLVDEGRIGLDVPIDRYLDKPLPDYTEAAVEDKYARWSDLAGDERWRKLTPRILLTHSAGFANFGFLEPDGGEIRVGGKKAGRRRLTPRAGRPLSAQPESTRPAPARKRDSGRRGRRLTPG